MIKVRVGCCFVLTGFLSLRMFLSSDAQAAEPDVNALVMDVRQQWDQWQLPNTMRIEGFVFVGGNNPKRGPPPTVERVRSAFEEISKLDTSSVTADLLNAHFSELYTTDNLEKSRQIGMWNGFTLLLEPGRQREDFVEYNGAVRSRVRSKDSEESYSPLENTARLYDGPSYFLMFDVKSFLQYYPQLAGYKNHAWELISEDQQRSTILSRSTVGTRRISKIEFDRATGFVHSVTAWTIDDQVHRAWVRVPFPESSAQWPIPLLHAEIEVESDSGTEETQAVARLVRALFVKTIQQDVILDDVDFVIGVPALTTIVNEAERNSKGIARAAGVSTQVADLRTLRHAVGFTTPVAAKPSPTGTGGLSTTNTDMQRHRWRAWIIPLSSLLLASILVSYLFNHRFRKEGSNTRPGAE